MEKTDIMACLKKRKKYYKNIKKIIVRLKNIFHKCRYANKSALKNCYRKDIFVRSFINF